MACQHIGLGRRRRHSSIGRNGITHHHLDTIVNNTGRIVHAIIGSGRLCFTKNLNRIIGLVKNNHIIFGRGLFFSFIFG